VDANLRIHDSPNTYVLGSGVFSASGAGHPTVLITAFAHRLADQLATQLRQAQPRAA
jgi:choline dehydrogenase-like flavoprotein